MQYLGSGAIALIEPFAHIVRNPIDINIIAAMTRVRASFLVALAFSLCAPLSAEESSLQIYTWRADTATELPGVTAMVWVDVGYMGSDKPPAGQANSARSPRQAARDASIALNRYPPSKRAILLFGAGGRQGPNGEPDLYPSGELNIDAYARGGFVEFTKNWCEEFWQYLAKVKAKPAFIVIDYEGGGGFWAMRQDFVRDSSMPTLMPDWAVGPVSALMQLKERIGELPGGYGPAEYVSDNGRWMLNRPAIEEFNAWAARRRARAIRAALFEPAWAAFDQEIPASNYDDQVRSWPGRDPNDWTIAPGDIAGSWSSPDTYLGIAGQRYSVRYQTRSLAFRHALSWVDRRNDVRSALAKVPDVAPWYSNPDFGRDADEDIYVHRLQWAAGLLHDRSLGVSVMLFWSDRQWTTDEIEFAKPILTYLQSMPVRRPPSIKKLNESEPEVALARWVKLASGLSMPR